MSGATEKILDKVRKLLRLGKDNASRKESESALKRAAVLLEKHGLTMEMVRGDTDDGVVVDTDYLDRNRAIVAWKHRLAFVVAYFNGCGIGLNGANMVVVGRKSDAEIVRFLYQHCRSEVYLLCRRNVRSRKLADRNSYRMGCVSGVEFSLGLAKEQAQKEFREEMRANSPTGMQREAEQLIRATIKSHDDRYSDVEEFFNGCRVRSFNIDQDVSSSNHYLDGFFAGRKINIASCRGHVE